MDTEFLVGELRRADPDRYLIGLFYNGAARDALFALFMLNHEIARTRGVVSDTRLGHIRLQWWRDEIGKIYEGSGGGQIPALSTLAPFIHRGVLPREWFEAILYAREFDLEDVAPASVEGLWNYADFITTPVSRIALKIVGEEAEEEEIRGISTIFGLQNIIRTVPEMLKSRRCYLPADLLAAKNLSPEKIMDFNHQEEIVQVIELLIQRIESYRKPQSRLLNIQREMSFIYLNYIKKNRFDIFSPKMRVAPPFLALRLFFSTL